MQIGAVAVHDTALDPKEFKHGSRSLSLNDCLLKYEKREKLDENNEWFCKPDVMTRGILNSSLLFLHSAKTFYISKSCDTC